MVKEKKKPAMPEEEVYNYEDQEENFDVDEEFMETSEYLTEDEAAQWDYDDPPEPEYDVFGKEIGIPDNPNKPEEDFFEQQLRAEFSEEEIAEQKRRNFIYLNRDRDTDISKNVKAQNMRKAIEDGTYDYLADIENFDDHLAFLDSVQEMLMMSPLFLLEQLREKKAKAMAKERVNKMSRGTNKVNIRDLCHALDETYMITRQPTIQSIRQDVSESMSALMSIAKDVFAQSVIYSDRELADLIGILNKVCLDREFLGMAISRDIYFKFVVDYANRLLAQRKEVPPEVISGLNILIAINSKLLNAILVEKAEMYAPLVGYVKNMKKNKKL